MEKFKKYIVYAAGAIIVSVILGSFLLVGDGYKSNFESSGHVRDMMSDNLNSNMFTIIKEDYLDTIDTYFLELKHKETGCKWLYTENTKGFQLTEMNICIIEENE